MSANAYGPEFFKMLEKKFENLCYQHQIDEYRKKVARANSDAMILGCGPRTIPIPIPEQCSGAHDW
jgi:hypothetical protein